MTCGMRRYRIALRWLSRNWPLQPNLASPETPEVVVRGSHQHMARGSSGEPAKTQLSMILTVLAVLTLLACAVIDLTLHALVPNESVAQTMPKE
jgi:hypothetical protein